MYKPITEYTEQELAAMRCWEIMLCQVKWQHLRQDTEAQRLEDTMPPEPHAAIYQRAMAEFHRITGSGDPEMEAWMDAYYDEIFPPEQPK